MAPVSKKNVEGKSRYNFRERKKKTKPAEVVLEAKPSEEAISQAATSQVVSSEAAPAVRQGAGYAGRGRRAARSSRGRARQSEPSRGGRSSRGGSQTGAQPLFRGRGRPRGSRNARRQMSPEELRRFFEFQRAMAMLDGTSNNVSQAAPRMRLGRNNGAHDTTQAPPQMAQQDPQMAHEGDQQNPQVADQNPAPQQDYYATQVPNVMQHNHAQQQDAFQHVTNQQVGTSGGASQPPPYQQQLPSQQAPNQQQQQALTPQEHAIALIAYLAGFYNGYNQNARAYQNRNQLQSLTGGFVAQRNFGYSGLQQGFNNSGPPQYFVPQTPSAPVRNVHNVPAASWNVNAGQNMVQLLQHYMNNQRAQRRLAQNVPQYAAYGAGQGQVYQVFAGQNGGAGQQYAGQNGGVGQQYVVQQASGQQDQAGDQYDPNTTTQ